MTSILGLSFAFPKYKVFQDDVKALGRKIFHLKQILKNGEGFYDNSGVKVRYLTNDLNWYMNEHNWSERNFLFKKNAILLLKKSISQTFEKSNTSPEDIGGIVLINSTGISTPTIDAEIFNLFTPNNQVLRLPFFGYGCSGGVLGLNRALKFIKILKTSFGM